MILSENQQKIGISGATLKFIALISMLIDHIGAVIIESGILHSWDEEQLLLILGTEQGRFWMGVELPLRMVGRLAFPIFCFLLVEGFLHTRNIKKYTAMVFVFALISEIPFNLAIRNRVFDPEFQNVYFTLLLGLLMMSCLKRWGTAFWKQMGIVAVFCGAAALLHCDYDMAGILMIACFYLFRNFRRERAWSVGLLAFIESLPCLGTAALALFPISRYSGERGQVRNKYFFYWFYPAHLLLLFLFNFLVLGARPISGLPF